MKRFVVIVSLVFSSLFLLIQSSCKKELPPALATVTTRSAIFVTHFTATTGGVISSPKQSPVTACGVCWGISPLPDLTGFFTTDAIGTDAFTSALTDLTPITTYYVRAYATNNAGTVYGDEISFTTLGPDAPFPVYDIDANGYDTIRIGSQLWLQQNLRTTRYRDGTAIVSIKETSDYFSHPEGGMGWPGNDSAKYAATYGAFYSWLTVKHPGGLCPVGWHVPSENEFFTLANAVGGILAGGGALKSTTPDWTSPNIGATNSSGFTGRPAGFSTGGSNTFIGNQGIWWSTLALGTSSSRSMTLGYSNTNIVLYDESRYVGLSVRCLRN